MQAKFLDPFWTRTPNLGPICARLWRLMCAMFWKLMLCGGRAFHHEAVQAITLKLANAHSLFVFAHCSSGAMPTERQRAMLQLSNVADCSGAVVQWQS